MLKTCFKIILSKKKQLSLLFLLMTLSFILNIFLPLVNSKILDEGIGKSDISVVIVYALINMLLFLIIQVCDFYSSCLLEYLNKIIKYKMESKAINHFIKLEYIFIKNRSYQEYLGMINYDIGNISFVIINSVFNVVTSSLMVLGGVIGLSIINWKMISIILFFTPLKLIINKYVSNKKRTFYSKHLEDSFEYSKWVASTFSNLKSIRIFNLNRRIKKMYSTNSRKLIKDELHLNKTDNIQRSIDVLLINFMTNTIYIVGAFLIFNNGLTIGSLFAFISYSSNIFFPINQLTRIKYNINSIQPSYERYQNFFKKDTEKSRKTKNIKSTIIKEIKTIEFKNISYEYSFGNKILDGTSFKLEKGNSYAILGDNGGGKTTIIDILLGLLRPQEGRIYVNNVDINNIDIDAYRQHISYVDQTINLFNCSIYDNIFLFCKNISSVKDSIIVNKILNEEFMGSLIYKMKDNVGYNGCKLSGGERQKIAIVRCLLRDSDLLIFDEATSNLDIISKDIFWETIKMLKRNKIIIATVHSNDELEYFDKILLFKKGKLLKQYKCSDYLKYVQAQE